MNVGNFCGKFIFYKQCTDLTANGKRKTLNYLDYFLLINCIPYSLPHPISKQGRRNRSGFGRTVIFQGKYKIPVLQKASNNQNASMSFGLVRLIMLRYNR